MNGVIEQRLALQELPAACEHLLQNGGRMQMAYAWFPEPGAAPEILYLAAEGAHRPFALWRCRPDKETAVPSLAGLSPLLGWYEREMSDLAGVRFDGHPEPYPLVLHEGTRPPLPPLDPGYQPDAPMPFEPEPWQVPEVKSKDVQRLPFGPVRADVLESAQFLFFYAGEAILHYYPKLFFKHRGMEKRFEGLAAEAGVMLAERVSGIGSAAHALAYCQAVEAACGYEVPARARYLRVLIAELERLYNHLHYLGYLCHTTTLKVGEAQGKWLEERVKQLNARYTGSRLLRGLMCPGGLRRDVHPDGLSETLIDLMHDIREYIERLERTNSHLDRLITTGVLSHGTAFDQGATGPVERASGLDRDLRRDHPYAAYAELPVQVALRQDGDAHARAQVRMEEIAASVSLIQRVAGTLPPGPVRAECRSRPGGEGLGWCESPRGSLYYAVHLDAHGRFARVKIKSPSFSNWRAFPFTVHDSNMMDYAINEASFGLSIAGCDR